MWLLIVVVLVLLWRMPQMQPFERVLALVTLAPVVYEMVALMGYYPPITTTVTGSLTLLVIVLAGLAGLAIHFVRAYQRRQKKERM